MVEIAQAKHRGLECIWMKNPYASLAVAKEGGLRALYFSKNGKENIFAELEHIAIGPVDHPYKLIGGHRLWHAPEWASRTYFPEPGPLDVRISEKSVQVSAPADESGVSKTLVFEMVEDQPQVVVKNILRNEGLWRIELSPWAITQCKPGGVVLCPEWTRVLDNNIAMPNRSWVFWQFSDIRDPRFHFGNSLTTVNANPGPATKIGYRNLHGWIGYWLNDIIFTKQFDPSIDRQYPDMGCNTEIYTCDEFVEVETLAPLTTLEPGESVSHAEKWILWEAGVYLEDDISPAEVLTKIPDFYPITL